MMTRRALFAMLAAALSPKPLTSPLSKWGGVRAYWLDEWRYPALSRPDIRLLDARLKADDDAGFAYYRPRMTFSVASGRRPAVWWINPDYKVP